MKKWSVTFRTWHWLFALTILFMATTVLLKETLLDKDTNAIVITNSANALSGVSLSADDAKDIAKELGKPLWEWHILGGYLFTLLLLVRLALFSTKSGKHNYTNCEQKTIKKKLISSIYILLYLTAIVAAITGLSMKFDEELGISHDLHHTIEEIHEFAFYIILAFIFVHITGVVVAENRDEQGIVSDMIHGGKLE